MSGRRTERRRHPREPVECPVRLHERGGGQLAAGRSENLSDGGVLVPLNAPVELDEGREVVVEFSLPRATPNTFLMEQVRAEARVVRREGSDGAPPSLALEFTRPLELGLRI